MLDKKWIEDAAFGGIRVNVEVEFLSRFDEAFPVARAGVEQSQEITCSELIDADVRDETDESGILVVGERDFDEESDSPFCVCGRCDAVELLRESFDQPLSRRIELHRAPMGCR